MQTQHGHLTYCTNIHPGEDWPAHFAALQQHFPGIKQALSPTAPMGIGLRLSNEASLQLSQPPALESFKQWLGKQDAYVFTMNGFPYGGFHHTVVKDQVHSPDWQTMERLQYTMRLFDTLAQLLPNGIDGGVSTSPLSYRRWFSSGEAQQKAMAAATGNMVKTAIYLAQLHHQTGKLLHLDIEPEPDGLLETGPEFIEWYLNHLLPAAVPALAAAMQVGESEAADMVRRHICLCYDVCHFAVGYEPHGRMLQQLHALGIGIGKFQVSAALKAKLPADAVDRQAVKDAFAVFNEPTYLHQVVARTQANTCVRHADLPQALDHDTADVEEWRAHFHVPVFEERFGLLESTQADICEVLQYHRRQPATNHLEVETYTWDVLSPELKLPIADSIVRELQWVQQQLHLV